MRRSFITFPEQNNGEKLVQSTGLRISQTDKIRQIIRHELFRQQEDAEHETFEEADDFDLTDGEEWASPYEENFEPLAPPESDPVREDSNPPDPSAVSDDENGKT